MARTFDFRIIQAESRRSLWRRWTGAGKNIRNVAGRMFKKNKQSVASHEFYENDSKNFYYFIGKYLN